MAATSRGFVELSEEKLQEKGKLLFEFHFIPSDNGNDNHQMLFGLQYQVPPL